MPTAIVQLITPERLQEEWIVFNQSQCNDVQPMGGSMNVFTVPSIAIWITTVYTQISITEALQRCSPVIGCCTDTQWWPIICWWAWKRRPCPPLSTTRPTPPHGAACEQLPLNVDPSLIAQKRHHSQIALIEGGGGVDQSLGTSLDFLLGLSSWHLSFVEPCHSYFLSIHLGGWTEHK